MVDDRRARQLIVAAVGLGFTLRLAFGMLYWVDKPLTHDEREYLSLARSIASGRGMAYDESQEMGTSPRFGRAPGYPLFLAALDAGRPDPAHTPARVKIAQSAVGAIGVWLIGMLAMSYAGARAGVAAAGLAAVYPPLVFVPAYVFSETLYSTLALTTALVLQRAVDRANTTVDGWTSGWLALGAGAVAGAAALVRPAMLFFLPLAVAWLLLRRRTSLAIALAAAAVAVCAPWTLRNWQQYDRFIVIASEGGVTFWTGNHPLARGEGDLAANPDLKSAELAFRQARSGLSPEALEPLYYDAALKWMASNPAAAAALVARKAFYTVVPVGPSYALHSTRYRVLSVGPYLLTVPFAIAGARRLWRSRRRPTALFLLAGSALLVCLVFFPQERFRIPVIDPVLIICAAALAGRSPS
jgi:4-amino-4-deoxy-L-arabinose transferase-like glycosyltransferase